MNRALILSDGRMGHLNQSYALVKHLNIPHDVVSVKFKYKGYKLLSYIFDKIGFYTQALFRVNIDKTIHYNIVIGTGSTVYYATKVIAKELDAKSVVMMLPKGYRYDFDIIFAQTHDTPPKQENIFEIPVNLSYGEPKGLYQPLKKSIGIIIGGENPFFINSKEKIQSQLESIKRLHKEYEIGITTSPRTTKEIEQLVESYHFNYEVIFSKNPINPIADFLEQCEIVYITADSTSMISEALCMGKANIVVLPLAYKKQSKFTHFVEQLAQQGYLHVFDESIQKRDKKIEIKSYLEGLPL